MSQAKERPILFSGPMVRAILEGRKTVTRRAIAAQPPEGYKWRGWVIDSTNSKDIGKTSWGEGDGPAQRNAVYARCPYGQPGDRLWVRETWAEDPEDDGSWAYTQYMGCKGSPLSDIPKRFQKPDQCIFRASWEGSDLRWRPSIHMPRWASRILLEITSVRVEQLQAISIGQICKEGLARSIYEFIPVTTAFDAFAEVWDSINGPGAWEANPWVWVVEFKRIEP